MTSSKMMQFLKDAEEKYPNFAAQREKAIASVAATPDDGDADAIVHRGYIVDTDDDSLFSSTEEVDEYLSVIAEFHKSEA